MMADTVKLTALTRIWLKRGMGSPKNDFIDLIEVIKSMWKEYDYCTDKWRCQS